MHKIQGWDGNIFNSKQLGKYTESTEALVAFKLSIDFPQNALNKGLCKKYHDWGQNIENFHVKALNGMKAIS